MKQKAVDDFIKYAKEQFGYDITVEESRDPDSFEKIFGSSFLAQENSKEIVYGLPLNLQYEDDTVRVELPINNEIDYVSDKYIALAA